MVIFFLIFPSWISESFPLWPTAVPAIRPVCPPRSLPLPLHVTQCQQVEMSLFAHALREPHFCASL